MPNFLARRAYSQSNARRTALFSQLWQQNDPAERARLLEALACTYRDMARTCHAVELPPLLEGEGASWQAVNMDTAAYAGIFAASEKAIAEHRLSCPPGLVIPGAPPEWAAREWCKLFETGDRQLRSEICVQLGKVSELWTGRVAAKFLEEMSRAETALAARQACFLQL